MKKRNIAKLFWLIATIIPILGICFGLIQPEDFDGLQKISREWIGRVGVFGPFVFILMQILQVVITPISHYSLGFVGGYLYGPYVGGLLNYIGRLIGHILAYIIARCYGRHLIEKYVDKKTIQKYDHIIVGEGKGLLQTFVLFLIYFLPLFPDDEISYMVGASRMPKKRFLIANIFGQLGGSFGLAYLGSGLDKKDPFFWAILIFSFVAFLAFLFVAWRQKATVAKQE
ncbi:MAG: TVP38/TMEM64 family protein [Bdellovibrionales bacterium]